MFEQYEVLCFSRFRPIRYKSPAKLLLLSVFTNRDRRISRVLPISCPQKEPKVKIVRTCGVSRSGLEWVQIQRLLKPAAVGCRDDDDGDGGGRGGQGAQVEKGLFDHEHLPHIAKEVSGNHLPSLSRLPVSFCHAMTVMG